jgi:hypothetical protein
MSRAVPLCIAAMLISCAGAPTVSGPAATRASEDDIRQLRRLASHAPRGWEKEWAPLQSIAFETPLRAKITLKDWHETVTFIAEKHTNAWVMRHESLVGNSRSYHEGDDPESRLEEIRPQIGR